MPENNEKKMNWWKITMGLFFSYLISRFFLPAIVYHSILIGLVISLIFTICDLILYTHYGRRLFDYIKDFLNI
ncbi:MAG: hypothetical protein ABH849_02925 [Nanoarchaeota archaeon]